MYCKYCGKQIDDDSAFCKYCGKSLVKPIKPLEDSSNSMRSFKPYIGIYKNLISIILSVVLWLIIGAYVSDDGQDFVLLLVTLFIAGMIFWFYKNYCKNQILLIDKSDTQKERLWKLIYILYIAIIPYCCLTTKPIEYAGAVAVCWLLPTIFIFMIHKSKKLAEEIRKEEAEKEKL